MEKVVTKNVQEMPAHNGRFGASGGVARLTVYADFEAFAPVRAAAETPACVKPLLRYV
jgi:hypothetical protein